MPFYYYYNSSLTIHKRMCLCKWMNEYSPCLLSYSLRAIIIIGQKWHYPGFLSPLSFVLALFIILSTIPASIQLFHCSMKKIHRFNCTAVCQCYLLLFFKLNGHKHHHPSSQPVSQGIDILQFIYCHSQSASIESW